MNLAYGLYGVADSGFGDPEVQARVLLDEGVRVVQLRCKGWSADALTPVAERIIALAIPHGALVVVNDAVDVARRVGAWAHLGQEDAADPADVPFGRSTHTLAQATHAGRAAYIGFGPVFGTATKDTGYAPRGIAGLEEVVAAAGVPVIAIGGVSPCNVGRIRATGAHGWAAIGAIWSSPDPRPVIRALR